MNVNVSSASSSLKTEFVTLLRRSAQAIDFYLIPKNFNEPMGAPVILKNK
ncbi:MAG: hypothetical protein P8X74_10195 [Reinekea sp.]